jgi:hypothetical protein
VSTIRPFRTARAPRDGLSDAFSSRGVALARSDASWSGVRTSDGSVLIALRSRDVLEGVHESRCLLWSPGGGALRGSDQRERFFHCKLAAARGEAFALVTHGPDDEVDHDAALLGIDVELRRGEYWAVWARAQPVRSPSRVLMFRGAEAVIPPSRSVPALVCCA